MGIKVAELGWIDGAVVLAEEVRDLEELQAVSNKLKVTKVAAT